MERVFSLRKSKLRIMSRWGVALGMGVFGFGGLLTLPVQAKTKTLKVTKVKRAPYYAKKGTIYTSLSLSKVRTKAKKVSHVTLYVTKHATVKQNGKKKVFYYIKSKTVKGWLWRGDLRYGKATPAISAMRVTAAQKFVAKVNDYRAAKGYAPIKLDSAQMKVMSQPSKWFVKTGKTYRTDLDRYGALVRAQGVSTDLVAVETFQSTSAQDRKNAEALAQLSLEGFLITSPYRPDYQNATLLQPQTTKVAVTWVEHHGTIYTMMAAN